MTFNVFKSSEFRAQKCLELLSDALRMTVSNMQQQSPLQRQLSVLPIWFNIASLQVARNNIKVNRLWQDTRLLSSILNSFSKYCVTFVLCDLWHMFKMAAHRHQF